MVAKILLLAARFVLLLLLQVFIVSKLNLGTSLQPNILLLFFLTLPLNLTPIVTLLTGFFGGLVLDIFCDSAGFHTTSFLVYSFARIYYINRFTHIDIRESGLMPGLANMGYRWFTVYTLSLSFVYHLCYAYIESFSFRYILDNFVSATFSTALSAFLVLLFQMLFFRTRSEV